MSEPQSDFPCFICGRELIRSGTDEGQPCGGVTCTTGGNYGSRAYDPMNGEYLAFNLCDDCLVAKGAEGRIFTTAGSIPVWVDSMGVCGAYPVDRPYVQWHKDLEPLDDKYIVEFEDIFTGNYPKKIRWNDGGEEGWPETLVASWMDAHPDELAEYRQIFPEHTERIDKIMADYAVMMEKRASDRDR